MSQFHYLEDASILASLGHSSQNIRACLLDSKTRFLVLSCPLTSDGSDTVRAIRAINQLCIAGFKPSIYRESGSDSIQIFLAFSALVDLDFATTVIYKLVSDATVIVHDSDRPYVLPLQQGFAWLNSDLSTKLECDQIAIEAAMAMFLHDLDSSAVPPELLQTLADNPSCIQESAISTESSPQEPLPAIDEEDKWKLQAETSNESVQTSELFAKIAISTCEDIPPADLPDIVTEVAVTGGQQLLLFPIELQLVQPELPKERPKRGRRARSNLPDDGHIGTVAPKLFSVSQFDAQGVQQFAKEVCDD